MNNDFNLQGIQWGITALTVKSRQYRHYKNYYEGRHRLVFASEKFVNTFGYLFREFADNLCAQVVDTISDRIQLNGFSVETADDTEATDSPRIRTIETAIADVWRHNLMDQITDELHLESFMVGDAFAIVWPDKTGFPVIYPQQAGTCAIFYDAEQRGLIKRAVKAWFDMDTQLVRLNLYYPDRIEKYYSKSGDNYSIWQEAIYSANAVTPAQNGISYLPTDATAFKPYITPGESWPLPNPYGIVPVFHIANAAPVGQMGRSQIHDAIPVQDALNKSICDMMVGAEYYSLPQRWATGLEVRTDPATGLPVKPFQTGVDTIFTSPDSATKFGEFSAGNLSQLLDVQNAFRIEIARVTGIPIHYLQLGYTHMPSGEALKALEVRLTSKINDRQIAWGNVWENLMAFCLTAMGFSDTELNADWEDTTPRNDLQDVQIAALKKALGVSATQVLREIGYTAQQIDDFNKENEEDAADNPAPVANPINSLLTTEETSLASTSDAK